VGIERQVAKMDERTDLYEQIVEEYLATKSVKQVVKNLGTNTIKVRKVLITEGLWESETSRNVGALYHAGKTTKEIAEELCMSEKNVQSYIPYSRGAYGGEKSNDAARSEEYRERMKKAAEDQVAMKNAVDFTEIDKNKVIQFPGNPKEHKPVEPIKNPEPRMPEKLPDVLRLKFELVAPYHTEDGKYDMNPEEEREFLDLAKAEKGISREVLVNGRTNLHAIHYMIQRLFGWQNSHLHNFYLSESDFDMVTDDQKVDEYLKLCGTLFLFPGADLDDRFWDDDYMSGTSFKSWLRYKYMYGYRDFSVENSYLRNAEHKKRLKERFGKQLSKPGMTLEDLNAVVMFENSFNMLIEGLSVRSLFRTSLPKEFDLNAPSWRSFQELLMQPVIDEYEDFEKRKPKDYKTVMSAMQELMNVRKNMLAVEKAIRYGQAKQVRDYYEADPVDVLHEMREAIYGLEEILEGFLSAGNPGVIPFADELFYNYDYGDDWCIRITCEDAYTAIEKDDHAKHVVEIHPDGTTSPIKFVPKEDIEYTSLHRNQIDAELKESLHLAYREFRPICVSVDGLNVMDDVGGLFGYQRFLKTINSKRSGDIEEREDMRSWAKSMGWTGRKTQPKNIL